MRDKSQHPGPESDGHDFFLPPTTGIHVPTARMSVKSAYRVLGIQEGAGADEVKNAYRIMALKWHPDRHHNSHSKDAAMQRFLEVTDAYRTLVREGIVQSPAVNNHREPPPRRRPPPMGHKNSSESSISVDSFVHMVATGSTETLPTPASSKRESLPSKWGRGGRKSGDDMPQKRNATPHLFSYHPPPRGADKGPAMYTPPPVFAPIPPAPPAPPPNLAHRGPTNVHPPHPYTGPTTAPLPKTNHHSQVYVAQFSGGYHSSSFSCSNTPHPPGNGRGVSNNPRGANNPPIPSSSRLPHNPPNFRQPNNPSPPVNPSAPRNLHNNQRPVNHPPPPNNSRLPIHTLAPGNGRLPNNPPPPSSQHIPAVPFMDSRLPNNLPGPNSRVPHNPQPPQPPINTRLPNPQPFNPRPPANPHPPTNQRMPNNPPPPINTNNLNRPMGPEYSTPHIPKLPTRDPEVPYDIPLRSIGSGANGEWAYSLALSLEDIFLGKHFSFGITRAYLGAKTKLKHVVIEIDIPAGCRAGTRILCRNVGHERAPGVFQDIAFVIEELPHARFVRVLDDLIADIRLPWVDGLRRQGGKVPLTGIDGRPLVIEINYQADKSMAGRSVVKGAGMPIRDRGQVVGRGNLIVQWEILPPQPRMMQFVRRLWGGK